MPKTISSLLFVPILKNGKLISVRCWQKEGMLWLEFSLFGRSGIIPVFLLHCVELIKFHPSDNSSQLAVAAGQSTVCSITPKLLSLLRRF